MTREVIERQLDKALWETRFEDLGTPYRGKVRDTYTRHDLLFLVTTDRISAFDVVLPRPIPFKGQVLNQIAAYFFERTADLVPNHVVVVPDPNLTVAVRCYPIPVEFVVRGYLAGHAWREYSTGRRMLCGKPLPDGLRQNSPLPGPMLTPATKASEGHDEDISREDILRREILDADTFDRLEEMALGLFARGTQLAADRGLILVDTKYEFGQSGDGRYLLIDEVHTPDSSRYFYADSYRELLSQNRPQRQLSKEFVREWLMARGFQGRQDEILPDLPDPFRIEVAGRYVELYETVTGMKFVPETSDDPAGRIRAAMEPWLGNQGGTAR